MVYYYDFVSDYLTQNVYLYKYLIVFTLYSCHQRPVSKSTALNSSDSMSFVEVAGATATEADLEESVKPEAAEDAEVHKMCTTVFLNLVVRRPQTPLPNDNNTTNGIAKNFKLFRKVTTNFLPCYNYAGLI